jgi:hypothetical protein
MLQELFKALLPAASLLSVIGIPGAGFQALRDGLHLVSLR